MINPYAMWAAKICRMPGDFERGECPMCAHPSPQTTIADSGSMAEFKISGLCQQCQDGTFDPESLKP